MSLRMSVSFWLESFLNSHNSFRIIPRLASWLCSGSVGCVSSSMLACDCRSSSMLSFAFLCATLFLTFLGIIFGPLHLHLYFHVKEEFQVVAGPCLNFTIGSLLAYAAISSPARPGVPPTGALMVPTGV